MFVDAFGAGLKQCCNVEVCVKDEKSNHTLPANESRSQYMLFGLYNLPVQTNKKKVVSPLMENHRLFYLRLLLITYLHSV